MATKKGKRRPKRSKAKSSAQRRTKARVAVHEGEEKVTIRNETPVPPADEAPVTDRGEAQVGAEEEVPVVAQGETPAEDEVRVMGADEVVGSAGDQVPMGVDDEAQGSTLDEVRFIVGDEGLSAADEVEVVDQVEDQTAVPFEETALVPQGDEGQTIVEPEVSVIVPDEASLPVREVAKEEKTLGRRKHARFAVKGGAKGRVAVVWDAVLLNLSLGGALIEHANVVRPGTPSSLEVDLQGRRIRLRCRVARSVADRIEVQPDGERELIYHTGLQFVEPSDETVQVIGDYLQAIAKDG